MSDETLDRVEICTARGKHPKTLQRVVEWVLQYTYTTGTALSLYKTENSQNQTSHQKFILELMCY